MVGVNMIMVIMLSWPNGIMVKNNMVLVNMASARSVSVIMVSSWLTVSLKALTWSRRPGSVRSGLADNVSGRQFIVKNIDKLNTYQCLSQPASHKLMQFGVLLIYYVATVKISR